MFERLLFGSVTAITDNRNPPRGFTRAENLRRANSARTPSSSVAKARQQFVNKNRFF
jgi:hypothetical protein